MQNLQMTLGISSLHHKQNITIIYIHGCLLSCILPTKSQGLTVPSEGHRFLQNPADRYSIRNCLSVTLLCVMFPCVTSHTTWNKNGVNFLNKEMKWELRKPHTIQWIKIATGKRNNSCSRAESPERTIEEHNPVFAGAFPVGNSSNPPPGHHYRSQLVPVQNLHL